jgi:hypothetical protein
MKAVIPATALSIMTPIGAMAGAATAAASAAVSGAANMSSQVRASPKGPRVYTTPGDGNDVGA